MADIEITSIDLAQGLKLKTLVCPKALATVVLKNPPKELAKAFSEDKVVAQKIMMAAFESLKKSTNLYQAAVLDIDSSFDKRPPKDQRELDDRVSTVNVMSAKVAEAQAAVAAKAASDAWDIQVKKNKDLFKYRAEFVGRTALGVISVTASVAHTVLSFGVSAVPGIVGIAVTVAGMATDIYNQARDIEKAGDDIVKVDGVLEQVWNKKAMNAQKVGRELAEALGVPFVKSIFGLDKLLTEFNAKIGSQDKNIEGLYGKAKELMSAIEKADMNASAKLQSSLADLGKKVTGLLNEISALGEVTAGHDFFYKCYRERCDTYKKFQGEALGGTAKTVAALKLLGSVASTCKTIVDVAKAIA